MKLGSTDSEARGLWKRLLDAHLPAQGLVPLLRSRVNEALNAQPKPEPTETEVIAMGKADELLEAKPPGCPPPLLRGIKVDFPDTEGDWLQGSGDRREPLGDYAGGRLDYANFAEDCDEDREGMPKGY